MEGPSLVIAAEELRIYEGAKVKEAQGTLHSLAHELLGQKLKNVRSWGKNLFLEFERSLVRIHFLMFGSYRLGPPRPLREAKLSLKFSKGRPVHFYSCAIRAIDKDFPITIDPTIDIMSKKWNPGKAITELVSRPHQMACDVLIDQDIFAGVGNIIKNEVLYRMKIHPEMKVSQLSAAQKIALVKETRTYALQFYRWKKSGQLKKHWQIFRKKECPQGHGAIQLKRTGETERISYICLECQRRPKKKTSPPTLENQEQHLEILLH